MKHNFISCLTCNSKAHSIFSSLNFEESEMMDGIKSCTQYKKGEIVFRENGIPHGLFCINHGKIKLTTSGVNGKEQILRLLKDGDVMGYRSMLSNDRYHCTAVAIEDTSICLIPKENFFTVLKNSPVVNFDLLRLLSNNLKQAEEQVVTMAQKNVRERVAEALLFFKATYGIDTATNCLNISLSREEIADFVGTSTETAIRLLSEFNTDGLIELIGKKIAITNSQKLLKTANLDD